MSCDWSNNSTCLPIVKHVMAYGLPELHCTVTLPPVTTMATHNGHDRWTTRARHTRTHTRTHIHGKRTLNGLNWTDVESIHSCHVPAMSLESRSSFEVESNRQPTGRPQFVPKIISSASVPLLDLHGRPLESGTEQIVPFVLLLTFHAFMPFRLACGSSVYCHRIKHDFCTGEN